MTPALSGRRGKACGLALYVGTLLVAFDLSPNILFGGEVAGVVLIIGAIGIWRYSWWLTHVIRAEIYARLVYPGIARSASERWSTGWRPRHVHFLLTTYDEHAPITRRVLDGVCGEIERHGLRATIWVGSSIDRDEQIVQQHLERVWPSLDANCVFVRQQRPGKRAAIGLCIRAMNRNGLGRDDLVVMMDGDSVMTRDALARALPIFAARPDVQAVTTDESVECHGPSWMAKLLEMRFAQRRLTMQSHALSRRLLVLTGRMSIIRGRHLRDVAFARLVEDDHLEHWLWGRFRFLSGDDKSTWFYLMQQDAPMLYVPDALVVTVERITGNPWRRLLENYRRWSGNMLRSGWRAICLGPRAMPPFIWWCLVDQRLSIWTMLVAPTIAVSGALLYDAYLLVDYMIWIAATRMVFSAVLWRHAGDVDLAYPPLLYLNQMATALVKAWGLFHIAQQRWFNRGNQAAGNQRMLLESVIAKVMVFTIPVGIALAVSVAAGFIDPPDRPTILSLTAEITDIFE